MTSRRSVLAAEFIGTAFLLMAVVGTGIMAERLSGGNSGLALLANSIATAGALYGLIVCFGPVSGAHFNPCVTAAMIARGTLPRTMAVFYLAAQIAGVIAGVLAAHVMFELPLVSSFSGARTGFGQWFAEMIAVFGLLTVIFQSVRHAPATTPAVVALYILAAYWFTSSTSFANPTVTLARAFTSTFAGIRWEDAPLFILAQAAGAALALAADRALSRR